MKKTILWHLKICEETKKAGLPWDFIKEYEGRQLYHAGKLINTYGLQKKVKEIGEMILGYLVQDAEFIPHLYKLYQNQPEVEASRIRALITGAGEEKLSDFSFEKIEEVLKDEVIQNQVLFWYLKYYVSLVLNNDKKSALVSGLLNWHNSVGQDIKELSAEERNLLMEPAFSSNLFLSIYGERTVWEQLLEPEKLALMNEIANAAWSWQRIQMEHFMQLMEKPKEFRRRFHLVTEYIDEKERPTFVNLWIENKALWNDLKRLEQILPDMDEEQIGQMLQDRTSYVSTLYKERIQGIPLENLSSRHEELMFYAVITNKKHFLALVRESYEDFTCLPYHSLLLDPDVYQKYLNLNTLNKKNLKECFGLGVLSSYQKENMGRSSYTFEELKLLVSIEGQYSYLYNQLSCEGIDARLKVFREIAKRKCLPARIKEEEMVCVGERLSQKVLSMWMQEEFGDIKHLRYQTAVHLLGHWEEIKPFIRGLTDENQALFLLRNIENLKDYHDFYEIKEHLMETDKAWEWLRGNLPIEDEVVEKHKENVLQFLYEGGSEILFAFCQNENKKKEEIRRLLTAELMGKFMELKYHEDDLEREIAYPITPEIKQAWMENLNLSRDRYHVWEEDRLLPVMQIGEIPTETCISYRNGYQSECLLSCFDSNKKVIFLEKDGDIVFRAILRLTKGSHNKINTDKKRVEFADLTKTETARKKEKEELILFLERPYYSRLSMEELRTVVSYVIHLVRQKAEMIGAKLVLSPNYREKIDEERFVWSYYYVYISASKNGSQYLDSLGGMATVNQSGRYGIAKVYLEKEKILQKSA